MSDYSGLILTVGMTHEPVIYSIQQARAAYVAFVCTPDSEKGTLDRVIADTGLAPSAWRKYVVADDPQQIGRLCMEFHSAYRWLTEECGLRPDKIAADPTAGRKWMSTGATMIAAFLGLAMHYVDVRFIGGKPDPATMKIVELGNAYDQVGFMEAERGRTFFNSFEFATAAQVFNHIHPSLSVHADLYGGLAAFAHALDRWERFEHYERNLRPDFDTALVRLHRHVSSLSVSNPNLLEFVNRTEKLANAIEELHKGPRPAAGFTVDVFENARRRVQQNRFEDACARLYRTLESISQLFLQADLGIDAAKPGYGHLLADQQAALRSVFGELPQIIDLSTGERILKALNHRLGDRFIAPDARLKFAGLLEDRDRSILAHGFKPIASARVGEFIARLEALLSDALGTEFQHWTNRLQPPKLPPIFA